MIENDLNSFEVTTGKLLLSEPLKFNIYQEKSAYPTAGIIELDVKPGIWTALLNHSGKGKDFMSFSLIAYLDTLEFDKTYFDDLNLNKDWEYIGLLPSKSGNVVLFDFDYLENGIGMPNDNMLSDIYYLHRFKRAGKPVPVFSFFDDATYLGVAVYNKYFVSAYEVYVQYTDDKITAVKVLFREEK